MSEGTENAEAQKPSKYKGFGQKVWRVRLEGRAQSASVQQALTDIKTCTCSERGRYFFCGPPPLVFCGCRIGRRREIRQSAKKSL